MVNTLAADQLVEWPVCYPAYVPGQRKNESRDHKRAGDTALNPNCRRSDTVRRDPLS